MKKKSVTLLLALSLVFSLLPAALAEESVTPTPPEWLNQEDYLIFPGDEVYEPENWAKIEALREDARNGVDIISENPDWAEGSMGTCYEIGLARLGYGVNLGVDTAAGKKAFYSAGRAFSAAQGDYWGTHGREYDEYYYCLGIEKLRAWAIYSSSYVSDWKHSLVPALEALDMTMEDFFAKQYMDLVPAERKAAIIAEVERISVFLDGGEISMDVSPEARNGRTMVPIRAVAEALGATVEWMQDTQEIVMTRAGVTVTMKLDSTTATIGDETVEMDVAPYASNGRTLIPARYVAEFFGQKVEWDGEKRQVLVTEDKSVAGDSNLEAWALPMGAMLAKMNSGAPTLLGIYSRSSLGVKECRGKLNGDSWNIPDREDLARTVLSMTLYGHDSTFREMAEDVKLRTEEERAAISAASDVWPSYMWEYTEYVDEKWGDRGIMTWDLFRMSNLVQWGYTAGYVTYGEALELLEPAATILCENFSSWDEAYENYLDGYNWWARNDVLGQDIWETYRGKVYLDMKADPKTAGIFDDALFQTGVIGLPDDSKT